MYVVSDATPTYIQPINPAVSKATVEAFTASFIVLYSLLFLLVYVQLILVLYYRYKRLSYQTVLLFLCLFWAGLRTVLFSVFIQDVNKASVKPNSIQHWMLYSFPVCLQYIILCLLVLYFAQVVLKAKVRFEPDQYRCFKWWLRVVVLALVLFFFIVNISSAIMISKEMYAAHIVQARVVINGLMFTFSSLVLSGCIWKIWRMTSANVLLEARGISVCQASTACVIIVLVFATRAVYNIVAVSPKSSCPKFGFTWLYVSDEADLVEALTDVKFILFGVILFIWEFLPTLVVVLFFRVKCTSGNVPEVKGRGKVSHRAYFFDDPRRYDSDEDLSRPTNAIPRDHNQDIPSLGSTPLNSSSIHAGYGALVRSSSYTSGNNIPGTTPPMLFAGNVSLGGYQSAGNGVFD
ncbi:G protein-coupled receptor 137Ba-like [Apostichopus japonicus]|uniref:G protein-coupled receptor 137Ba-like n=1 Tax=Stichopus japonicus TaxID=307972 RepID=UPI003AB5B0DC